MNHSYCFRKEKWKIEPVGRRPSVNSFVGTEISSRMKKTQKSSGGATPPATLRNAQLHSHVREQRTAELFPECLPPSPTCAKGTGHRNAHSNVWVFKETTQEKMWKFIKNLRNNPNSKQNLHAAYERWWQSGRVCEGTGTSLSRAHSWGKNHCGHFPWHSKNCLSVWWFEFSGLKIQV